MFSCKFLSRAVIILTLTALSFSSLASEDRFLDSYSLQSFDRGYILKIRFNESVSYLNNYTEDAKKTIKINIRPLLIRFIPLSTLKVNEIIHGEKGNNAGLHTIRLENTDNNQLVLTLHFKTAVTFNITQDSGNKIISVYLDQVGQSKKFQQQRLSLPNLSEEVLNKYYSINLLSSQKPLNINNAPKRGIYKKHKIYITNNTINGKDWNRLRLGYFSSWMKAKIALRKIKKHYPKAWISRVNDINIQAAKKWLALDTLAAIKETKFRPKKKHQFKKVESEINTSDKNFILTGKSENKKVQFLMEKGRNAMIDGKYRKAISYYKKAYQLAQGNEKKLALEYLGLARERNGQIAQAKAAYRKYVKDYPKGESAERVKQRLETILTARLKPKKRISRPNRRTAKKPEWETYGTLFQFYRYQTDDSNQNGRTTVDNSLSTNISVSTRRRSEDYDMRFQFDGSNRYDALKTNSRSDSRLSKLYADITSKKSGLHARIGRQTSHNYGILGRFDGAIIDYPLSNKYKTTLSFGYPVLTSRSDNVVTTTHFYGAGLDITDIINDWDATFYAIQQTRDGITERQAIGSEVRSVTNNRAVFGLLDYDISYSELNTATIITNWLFGKQNSSTINLVVDYRKSPTLTTSNALIGQTVSTLADLAAVKTEAQLRGLAEDRTATYKTITLSGSTPLSKKYQLNGDITFSNLSSTPASGGVAATQSTGNEVAYSLQFIGNNLLTDNDVSIIAVRIANRSIADTTTYDLNSRIILNKKWRIRPRFRYEVQTQNTGVNRTIFKPSIRVDYNLRHDFRFELDTGYDFKQIDGTTNSKETSFYFNLGYIYDF